VTRRRGARREDASSGALGDEGTLPTVSPRGATGIGQRAGRGILWLGLANALDKTAQVVTVLANGRFLTAREFGTVTVAISMVNLGQIFQSAGMFDILARERDDAKRMASTLATLSLGLSIAAGLVLVFLSPVCMSFLGLPAAVPLVQVCAASLPFFAYCGAQSGLMHRELDFQRRVLPEAGSSVAAASLAIASLTLGYGIWAIAVWILSKSVLQTMLGLLVGVRITPGWDAGRARVAIRWFGVTAPGAVIGLVLLNVDYFFVTRVLGVSAAGVYSFAYRIIFLPYVSIAMIIGAVSFPVFARLVREGASHRLPEVAQHFLHAVFITVGGAYLIAVLEADRLVVVSARWADSVLLLRILAAYGLLLSLLLMAYELLRAGSRPQLALAGQGFHLAFLTVLLAVGTSRGLLAVCEIQVGAVLVTLLLMWLFVAKYRLAEWRTLAVSLRGSLAAAAITAGSWAGLSLSAIRPDGQSLMGGLLEVCALSLIYCVALYFCDTAAVRNAVAIFRR
jgi:O-antigen/teichoic acid export membrane protein